MGEGEVVKLIRSPIDTNCVHCDTKLPFGVWVYYEPETGNAVCIECGTKKGWTPKDRVNLIIKKLEIQEDIKALKKERKLVTESVMVMERKINLYEIGENYPNLEGQITKLMAKVDDYLRTVGSSDEDEKKALKTMFDEIKRCRTLQKQIRDLIHDRLFMLERRKRKLDVETAFAEEESQQQQEE